VRVSVGGHLTDLKIWLFARSEEGKKSKENDFRSAYSLATKIFLRELILSNTLSFNPKGSRSVDLAFSHKLLFYFH
jgi:hypothetical protein